MLEFLRGKASDRKLRLFACACYRLPLPPGWNWFNVSFQDHLELTERYPEGPADPAEFAAFQTSFGRAWEAAGIALDTVRGRVGGPNDAYLAGLCRDIFDNPFRPSAVDRLWLAWRDATIPKLAQAIYDDRAFDRLPALADTLEEAGCHDADILGHCRGPGPHVRGCWVVDLLV